MQPPNSEISATTNGGHYKELGLEKYPDWYYQKKGNYSEGSIPRGVLACFLPKSRDIQGKMPSPKVIRNAF